MGVTHKLTSELEDFIITYAKDHPGISCRKMCGVIKAKFKINLSKSTINSIIKPVGLSGNVGRPAKEKKARPPEEPKVPIKPEIKPEQPKKIIEPEAKPIPTMPPTPEPSLRVEEPSLARELSPRGEPSLRLEEPYFLTAAELALGDKGVVETSYYEAVLADGSRLYIDAQMRSVWSTSNIPKDFSISQNIARTYINKIIDKYSPLILLKAPADLDYIFKLKQTKEVVIYLEDLKEMGKISGLNLSEKSFIFGLWPQDMERELLISPEEEFHNIKIGHFKEDLYFAEGNVQSAQRQINKGLTNFRSIILKKDVSGRVIFNIGTNIPKQEMATERIIELYFEQWPNPQDSLNDFNQKIELLNYGLSRDFKLTPVSRKETSHLYCLRHFFPLGCEKLPFSTIERRFYTLKAEIQLQKHHLWVKFLPEKDYVYLQDLHYASNRVNEQPIFTAEGLRLRFLL